MALTGGPFVLAAQQGAPHSYVPDSGFVPDPATAIRIAEAVWIPIYGQVQIERERPFRAVLKDGVWTVTGSLPAGRVGGVAVAQIGRRDGQQALEAGGAPGRPNPKPSFLSSLTKSSHCQPKRFPDARLLESPTSSRYRLSENFLALFRANHSKHRLPT